VTLQWWTARCHNCALPPGISVPFLGSSGNASLPPGSSDGAYALVYCGEDVQVRVSAEDGLAQTLVADLDEHGIYTVLVRNVQGGAPLVLLEDIAGDFPYAALIIGAFVMCAIAVLNKVLRHCLIRHELIAPAGSTKRPQPVSTLAHAAVLFSPLWHFLGYDTYAAELAARAAVVSGAAEPLLPPNASDGGGDAEGGAAAPVAAPAPAKASASDALLARLANRIRSIDAFRGACLCFMIFFNYGGGGYWFMDHSKWNGLTVCCVELIMILQRGILSSGNGTLRNPQLRLARWWSKSYILCFSSTTRFNFQVADLVFPCFVFTQGVSMAIR
jgi:hypothetical protein